MDFAETEERALLRRSVAGIASAFGHWYYLEQARSGARSTELWTALADAGFIGVSLPAEFGGGGRGLSELAVVCEECAAAGTPLLLLLVSPAICGAIIARFGDPAQQARWLPPLADGRAKMAFAITEPDAGSNSHRISTVATRDGDLYRLSGTKYYISGVDESPQMLVVTRTGIDQETGRAQLSLLVVDTDAPGLTKEVIPVEIVAPEKQFTVYFDNVEVPADRLIGGQGSGLSVLFAGLNPERILSAALCNGVARYALGKASAYARDRSVWGVPIGSHQGVAHPLAKAHIDVELARLMTDKAAWLYDAGLDAGESSNMAKLAAADAALVALDQAIQTHGGTAWPPSTVWPACGASPGC